jgi:thiol-disulfide isomerase/thioredoxin
MSKAARVREQNARAKIEAQRAAARRAETRRRILIAGGSVAVVLALVAGLAVAKLLQAPARATPASAVADPAVARSITSIPGATFNSVGAGTATGLKATTGQPELTVNGKPELLYMGGEYCPFCAAERWAIAAAVSRFGTLSGLHFIHSSPTNVYPSTPTLSFYKSRYTSKYLAFAPVEWYGEKTDPTTPFSHAYLQHPTPQQAALFAKYAGGSLPFVDIGNKYLVPQAQYLPSALAGLSWAQVAAAMRDPGSAVGKDIDGAANMITAAICKLTHGQPRNVCASPGVAAAARSL